MTYKISKIVVFSDCTDFAYNEIYQSLRRELASNNLDNIEIDPLVPIKPFSIINASFAIRLLAELYTEGTLFLVIVNGTNQNPARIFGETGNGLLFVGNNSGYFNWMIQDFGIKHLYENHLDRTKNGKSFGGKYVQVPTAARIIKNIPFDELGIKKEPSSFLSSFCLKEGTVVHCDNFGLMKIKGAVPQCSPNQKFQLIVNGKPSVEAIYTHSMKLCADDTWVIFQGSSLNGLPEIGKVRCSNSSNELGVTEGDHISWQAL